MSITREEADERVAAEVSARENDEDESAIEHASEAAISAVIKAYEDGFTAGDAAGRRSQHELSTKAERDRCAHVVGVNALELQSRIASGQ